LDDLLGTEINDPRILELRDRVRTCPPHVPQPGDPDYQTPEQVARIKRERAADLAAMIGE
jgi:hypothetical protein